MAGIKWGKKGKTENQKNQPPCQHLGPPPTTTVPRHSAVSSSAHNQTCLEPEPPGMRVAALPLAPLRAAKQLLHNTVSSAANSTRSPIATTLIDPYHHARPPNTTKHHRRRSSLFPDQIRRKPHQTHCRSHRVGPAPPCDPVATPPPSLSTVSSNRCQSATTSHHRYSVTPDAVRIFSLHCPVTRR